MRYTKLVAIGLSCLLAQTTLQASGDEMALASLQALKMPKNGLPFSFIKDYASYRIVATHFRTDKNELRYILANSVAYNALKAGKLPLPNGSKVVKIGWDVKNMATFPAALEANGVQRIEYMIKDPKNFPEDGWGYARYVKEKGRYKSWTKGTKGCVACHDAAKENDYLFTRFQPLY